jgi:hypothetical protein
MEAVEAVRDGSGVGFQPGIVADELWGFAHCRSMSGDRARGKRGVWVWRNGEIFD